MMNSPDNKTPPPGHAEKRGIVDEHTPTVDDGLDAFEQFERDAHEIVRRIPPTKSSKEL